jgi:Polyketide cyclase / dehydrase and lipid transport
VRFTVESDIARPPEAVFDRMADARNEPDWNTQVSRSELLSDEPVGQGSRFRTVNRGKPYDATITTARRPELLVFEVTGGAFDITTSFAITAAGAGAHVVSEFDFRPKGAMKLILPLMQSAIRKDLARQSQNFRQFCEGA